MARKGTDPARSDPLTNERTMGAQNDNVANAQQNGNDNAYGVFQFGETTNTDVVQNGNGETGATVVIGW